MALAVGPEAAARADGDVRLLEQSNAKPAPARPSGIGAHTNIVAGGRGTSQPIRASPSTERVPPALVDRGDLGRRSRASRSATVAAICRGWKAP